MEPVSSSQLAQLEPLPPLEYPFDIVEGEKPWWRCSEAEALARATQAGWRSSEGELNWHLGTIWDGCSSTFVQGVEIAARKLSKLLGLISRDIRQNSLPVRRLPNFRDVRFRTIYDSCQDEEVGVVAIVFDFSGFSVPIAVEAPWLSARADNLLKSVAHDFGLWLRDASKHRATLCKEACAIHEQVDAFAEAVGTGFVPLRLQMQPKLCYVYDGWPYHASFELLSCVLDSNLDWRLDVDEIERNKAVPFRADDAATYRGRSRMLSVLQETASCCFVADVALAVARERNLDLAQLIEAVRKRQPWGGSEIREAEGDLPGVAFFMQERTLQVRFSTDQVTYSAGCLTMSGQYPALITMSSQGRQLADIVDYQPFRAVAAHIIQSKDRGYALELHHDQWSLPSSYALAGDAEDHLKLLRSGKRKALRERPVPTVIEHWHLMR